jgi:hypothetical protein
MKKSITLIIGVLFIVSVNAQTPQLSWTKSHSVSGSSYDYSSYMKIYNADNSVYSLASTDAFGTGNDILLIKRNSSGDTLWTRRFNGSANGNDQPAGIDIDQTFGTVYITGKTSSSTNEYNIVTQSYSPVGFLYWTQIWTNPTYSGDDYPCGISVDGNGNIFIGGTTYNGSSYLENMVAISYNKFGNSLGDFQVNVMSIFGFDFSREYAKSITSSGTGNVFLSGEYYYNGNTIPFSIGLQNTGSGFTSTYSSSCTSGGFGTYNVNLTGSGSDNLHNAITSDNSNNVYTANVLQNGLGFTCYQIKIVKQLSTGCITWSRYSGCDSFSNNNLKINAIKVDGNNGNVYAVGYETVSNLNKNILIMKYNSSGTLQWRITKNGSGNGEDIGYDLAFDSQLNPVITGKTRGNNSLDNIAIIKLNKNDGSEIFNISYNPNFQNHMPQNILLDGYNNIYINGWHNTSGQNTNIFTTKFCSGSVTADAGIDTVLCAGSSVQLSGFGGGTYLWNPTIGLSSSSTSNPIASPASTTKYYLQVTSNGCQSTDSVIVVVKPKPNPPSVLTNSPVCEKDTVKFNANTNQTGVTYIWYAHYNKSEENQNVFIPNVSLTEAGNFWCKILKNGCLSDSSLTNVIVNPKPNTSIISGNVNVEPKSIQTYSVNNTIGSSYNWLLNRGIGISTSNSISVAWDSIIGNGYVKTIETSNKGCKGDTISLNVMISNFTLNVTPSSWNFTNGTGNKQLAITSNTNWSVNSNQSWLTLSKSSGNGNDNITATVTANVGTNSRNATITFTAGSLIQIIGIKQDSTPITADQLSLDKDTIKVNSIQSSSIVQLQSNRSWSIINPASWLTITPSNGTGNQFLSLNIQANTGGARSADIVVTAGATNKFLHIEQDGVTGINEVSMVKNIKVYPNPSSGLITIDFNYIFGYKNISIIDITGKVIRKLETENKELLVNFESFAKGIYFVIVQTDQGISNSRFILE